MRVFSFLPSLSTLVILVINITQVQVKENELELQPPWLETYRYVNETYRVICTTQIFKNLTWKKSNGQFITEKDGNIRVQKIQSGLVLTFERLSTSAEGEYQCSASDYGIIRSSFFHLRVTEPIIFTSPTLLYVIMHEDVRLECEVKGNHSFEKHWEFNGKILTADEPYSQNASTLPIQNVGVHHAGKYLCIVAQSPFQSNRNKLEVTLVVYHKPISRHGRKPHKSIIYGFINETSTIVCEVVANPEAWFVWNKNFEVFDPKTENITVASGNNTSTLQVTLTKRRSEEKFSCEACNELGCLKQTFSLHSTQKLKKPDIGFWDTSSNSAELYVSFQPEAAYYIFEYFYSIYDYNWTTPFVFNFTTSHHKPQLGLYMKFQLSNLHPETKYVTRVAAGNDFTLSEFSDEKKFKTRVGGSLSLICNSSILRKCDLISFIVLLLAQNIIGMF